MNIHRLPRGGMVAGVLGRKSLPTPGYILGTNLLTNGDFEVAGSGGVDVFASWTEEAGIGSISADTVVYHSGTKSAKLVNGSSSYVYIYTSIPISVTPGLLYKIPLWIRGDGSNSPRYGLYNLSGDSWIKSYIPLNVTSAAWEKREILFVPPAGCLSVSLFIFGADVANASMNLDEVSCYRWQHPQWFYDNFMRPDGESVQSPGGFPYDSVNTGGLGNLVIRSSELTIPSGTGYGYNYVELPSSPRSIKIRFSFKNDQTGNSCAAVMATSNSRAQFQSFRHMTHFYCTPVDWTFQTVDDSGVFGTLGNGVLDLHPGITYEMEMKISGNTVTLLIPTIGQQTITDASIGVYHGQHMFYELIRTAADGRTPAISYVEARY